MGLRQGEISILPLRAMTSLISFVSGVRFFLNCARPSGLRIQIAFLFITTAFPAAPSYMYCVRGDVRGLSGPRGS